jgi:hypothetical protein
MSDPAWVFIFVTFTWIFFRARGDTEYSSLEKAWLVISRIFTAAWTDPRCPLLMVGLVLAVWVYQLLYTSHLAVARVLEWSPVRVGLAVAMIAYLAIVAQPSANAFIYFQF